MHNDVITWSLMLQVVALLLTLPLAIVGTLLAPKVEDWFATRSKQSLAARIAQLERTLSELDKEPLLTKTENQIVQFLERTVLILGYIIAVLMMVIYRSTQVPFVIRPPVGLSMRDAIIYSGLFGLVIVMLVWPIRIWRKDRTEKYREALRGKIESLKMDLSMKGL